MLSHYKYKILQDIGDTFSNHGSQNEVLFPGLFITQSRKATKS